MEHQVKLLKNIYFKEPDDIEWRRWSFTDGCPTGREYAIYVKSDEYRSLKELTECLNACIVATYEIPIQPVAIKAEVEDMNTHKIEQILLEK